MDAPLYWLGLTVVRLLQALPLDLVARIGRAGGALAYWLDGRHRRVAVRNIRLSLGGAGDPAKDEAWARRLARENFRRIGEAYCSAVKTAGMSWEALRERVEMVGSDAILDSSPGRVRRSVILAIGHFGNFEVYARFANFNPAWVCAATYRGLQPPALNRLLQALREKSGCRFFERRTDAAALRAWMAPEGRVLGLLADQHAGRSGVRSTFFGRECATTVAPAVLALRYNQALHTAVCYRVGLARWRIEFSEPIPTVVNGVPRTVEAITGDINREFEAAVRRDPANWFWVHNRWKPDKLPPVRGRRAAAAAAKEREHDGVA